MRRLIVSTPIVAFALPALLLAQDAVFTSKPSGMEFVLIQPGSLVVSRYQPRCPAANYPPPAGATGGRGFGQRVTSEMHEKCLELVAHDSLPGFTVKIEKPFYMAKYEVTQEEWTKVMGSNPSHFQGGKVSDDAGRHPVESVTWEMAQQFIAKLNKLERTKAYRLPTEFEWEYAARAGGTTTCPGTKSLITDGMPSTCRVAAAGPVRRQAVVVRIRPATRPARGSRQPSRLRRRLILWGKKSRTPGASTTWLEMSGNGCRTTTTTSGLPIPHLRSAAPLMY